MQQCNKLVVLCNYYSMTLDKLPISPLLGAEVWNRVSLCSPAWPQTHRDPPHLSPEVCNYKCAIPHLPQATHSLYSLLVWRMEHLRGLEVLWASDLTCHTAGLYSSIVIPWYSVWVYTCMCVHVCMHLYDCVYTYVGMCMHTCGCVHAGASSHLPAHVSWGLHLGHESGQHISLLTEPSWPKFPNPF